MRVPVYAVAHVAKRLFASVKSISVPENPEGSAKIGYERVTVPMSVLFSSNRHSRVIRVSPRGMSVVTSDPVAHQSFHQ